MRADKLGIYLNDHLAGATFGVGIARRIAHQHRGSVRAADLERIGREIAQDRQTLLDIMDALGVPARRYKIVGGWAAERLGRLKPNGVLYRRSGLSTFIELETLRLGVEGKTLIWRTLLAVATGKDELDETRLRGLLDRARAQIDTLERLRLEAASTVFASDAPE
ncbi:hypothetical protein OG552_31130 [Streptomyces sp. NBC_01476]|uniref:hypothetical protein n=1 Tax=Streptomyces sp. NBC_01476 TaxID=2903881 RepID=UPI002E337E93|nr:hypothetical protein [Streptomyces sp. NBC_01476]